MEIEVIILLTIGVAWVSFGAWLWWRFPIFSELALDTDVAFMYWVGMVGFAVSWPSRLELKLRLSD